MDNLKDKSIHFTAQTISEEIRQMPMYKGFYNQVQVCATDLFAIFRGDFHAILRCTLTFSQKIVSSPCVSKDDFRPSLLNAMRQTGLEVELRNTVFHWLRAHPGPQGRFPSDNTFGSKEPISYLKKAQVDFRNIKKSNFVHIIKIYGIAKYTHKISLSRYNSLNNIS
jgi:hypothetical protein